MSRAAYLVFVLLLGAPLAATAQFGQVHVVDDSGGVGVDFTSIAEAVQAAASSDVLLIRSGTYTPEVTIDGKSLVLEADAGATVDIHGGPVIVRNLSASQAVTFRGLHGFATDWDFENNAGTVWIEDCFLEFGGISSPGTISAVNCAQIVVIRCEILDLSAISTFGDNIPSDAVNAVGSRLTLLESTLEGGSGDLSMTTVDVPGAEAVELVDSPAFLGGSALTGGPGATEPGGAALLSTGGVAAWLLDNTLTGGTGSPPGPSTEMSHGSEATVLPGSQSSFVIDSPKRVGETISLSLQGPPGHQAWLLKSLEPGGLVKPGWGGDVLIDPSSFVLTALGNIPASGTLSLTATVPAIAGLDALPLFMQGLTVGPGGVRLASGSHLLLLAADF